MSEVVAPKIDWGWDINPHMEAARRSLAESRDEHVMLTAKLKEVEAARSIGGVEGIRIVREHRAQAKAIVGASIERQLPEISDDGLPAAILETVLDAEILSATSAPADPFVHQLKLQNMCETLTGAVVLLLCRELKRITPEPQK